MQDNEGNGAFLAVPPHRVNPDVLTMVRGAGAACSAVA
jgi:hypothetical protein